jgi:hypothetical protein
MNGYTPQLVHRASWPVKTRPCETCGKPYEYKNPRKTECNPCHRIRTKARQKAWVKEHYPNGYLKACEEAKVADQNLTKESITSSSIMRQTPEQLIKTVNRITRKQNLVLAAQGGKK